MQLDGYGRRRPAQLSGGQQQRVALARALVNRPQVLLLDEPLGALDLKLRRQMQLELKRIQTEVGITFVHVTHDQEEAMTHGRHGRGDERRAGSSSSARRPTSTSTRPPRSWRTSSASPTCSPAEVAGAGRRRRARSTAHGSRFAVPAGRCRVDRPGRLCLGVRPEKLHLVGGADQVPAGPARRRRRHRRPYVGVSTQYLVRTAWGGELSVFVGQHGPARPLPVGRRGRRVLGPAARVPAAPGRRRAATAGRRCADEPVGASS